MRRQNHDNRQLDSFFFFNDTATTEIYTLSLHDALPIYTITEKSSDNFVSARRANPVNVCNVSGSSSFSLNCANCCRSEEHTSELQSPCNLVCRLLLEKKKKPPLELLHNTSFLAAFTTRD